MKLNREASNAARLDLNRQIAKQYPGAAVELESIEGVEGAMAGTVLCLTVRFEDGFQALTMIDLAHAWIQ